MDILAYDVAFKSPEAGAAMKARMGVACVRTEERQRESSVGDRERKREGRDLT